MKMCRDWFRAPFGSRSSLYGVLFPRLFTIADLAGRVLDRKIGPNEMGGTSKTISNLAGIGSTTFTPIVSPTEVAILGITRTRTETVWNGDTPRPVPMVPLDLSYDHRVINGPDAARFLTRYTGLIGNPRNMLI